MAAIDGLPLVEGADPMSDEQERQRRLHEKLEQRGYTVLDAWEPDAVLWCFASDCEADRGTDSYGDCADCGEPVRWVRTPITPIRSA